MHRESVAAETWEDPSQPSGPLQSQPWISSIHFVKVALEGGWVRPPSSPTSALSLFPGAQLGLSPSITHWLSTSTVILDVEVNLPINARLPGRSGVNSFLGSDFWVIHLLHEYGVLFFGHFYCFINSTNLSFTWECLCLNINWDLRTGKIDFTQNRTERV